MKKTFFLLIIFLFTMMAFTTNASVRISGKVINDSTNKPMDSVKVVLMTFSDSTIISETISGKNGNFRIDNVYEGLYRLKISCQGFIEIRLALTVTSTTLSPVTFPDFRLKASDKVSEIVVPMRIPYINYENIALYVSMTHLSTIDIALRYHGRYL